LANRDRGPRNRISARARSRPIAQETARSSGRIPANVDSREGKRHVVLDPVVLVVCLGLIAVLAVSLSLAHVPPHRAQQVTAIVVVLFFLVSVLLSSTNGLVLLFLLPPVFNGEDAEPYFFLLEVLVFLTLVRGFVPMLWRRPSLVFPYAPFVSLFLVSTVVSLPLNLKETWLDVQVTSWPEILEGLRRSILTDNLFYVRTVLNVMSGIALYVLVVNHRWTRETFLRLAVAATLLYTVVTVTSLWLYWFDLFPGQVFLTVWIGGPSRGGFTGLGFNMSYFAQYALAYLPLAGLVLVERTGLWAKGLAAAVLLVSGYTLLVTYQRGAYIVSIVVLGLLFLVGLSLRDGTWSPASGTLVVGTASVGILIASALLVLTPLGPRVLERILLLWQVGDSYRTHVLGVAWRMFMDHPLLGVGSGRFAYFFDSYSGDPSFHWGALSTHSLYAQLLAEQGTLGLLSFLAILLVSLGPILLRQRNLSEVRPAVLFLLVSLGAWLTYGWLQYTFLLRSMQIYFWITLALLVSLSAPAVPPVRVPRRWIAALLAIVAVAGAWRVQEVTARPVPGDYAWGFSDWQGGEVWRIRGGAVLNLRVEGRALRLTLASPDPQVTGRPQTVSVWLDGTPVQPMTLDTPGWRTTEIPVHKPVGSAVLLQIRAGDSFVPAFLGRTENARRRGVLIRPITWLPGLNPGEMR
jgi:O-antigen ligase